MIITKQVRLFYFYTQHQTDVYYHPNYTRTAVSYIESQKRSLKKVTRMYLIYSYESNLESFCFYIQLNNKKSIILVVILNLIRPTIIVILIQSRHIKCFILL